ncbi:TrmB family transcriptional regulator [Candidatus Woesearchaeota archaeon]|nr:MAG: TrmB family transcriptional regulator [Candidatus Woesearchaeota archaeon]
MIVDTTFINKLRDFGLNSYEAKIWTALLSKGISSAGELSDISNVPRSRSYDVLESLEKKGFIIMKIGKPIKYIAVPPQEVIERVKKRVQKEAEIKTKIIEEIRSSEILEELNMLYQQGINKVESSDLAASFNSRRSMYNQLGLMLNNAKKSVIIMTTAEGIVRKINYLHKNIKKLCKRGIQVRIATTITKENLSLISKIADDAEIRHTEQINARFVIIDGTELAFMLSDDKKAESSADGGIWANTPFFANALQIMFDNTWDSMQTLEERKKSITN